MRAESGCLGAFVGAMIGGIPTVWLVDRAFGDNDFGAAFSSIMFGPIGLVVGLAVGIGCGLKAFDFLHRPDPDGTLRSKKKRLGAALVLGPLLAIGLPLYSLQQAHDPPSDTAMLAHFAAHRTQFDELAQMARHDKQIVGLYPERVNYDKPNSPYIAAARLSLYLQKLHAAGVPSGFRTGDNSGEIDFLFWSYTTVKGKDFAYLPKPPVSALPSLNGLGIGQEGISYYRHIDGLWYLHYEFYGD